MAIDLQPGEQSLGSWSVYHEPRGGRPVSGNLHITSHRIIFDALMEAGGRGVKQARQALSSGWKAQNSIAIERSQVAGVESKKGLLSKRVTISTASGASYVFNRGIMSIDPIMAALGRG